MASKSIRNAKTPFAVYQALVAAVTERTTVKVDGVNKEIGAVINSGAFGMGIRITDRNQQGFLRSNGKTSYPCRTNKWLPTATDAIVAFGKSLKGMSLETAQELGYELRDQHTIRVTIWEDTPNFGRLMAGRPFSATISEPIEYVTSDGEVKSECVCTDIAIEVMEAGNSTVNESLFALVDPNAAPAQPAVVAAKPIVAPVQ
jgi:hypothetical protein